MPLPKPRGGEERGAFISRCMGDQVMRDEYPEQDQRAAVCNSQWRRKPKEQNMTTVRLKDETGKWQPKAMSTDELFAWFEENTKDGAVTDEIELFTEVKMSTECKEGVYDWTMSDMSLDRDNERMDPTGGDFRNFKKNPVVLWAHDPSRPAIGKVQHPSVREGKVRGKIAFDPNDPFAQMISAKVRDGFLSAGSVGFKPTNVEFVEDSKDPTRLIHRKWELIEFSICNMPSNINAMVDRSAEPEAEKTDYDVVPKEDELKERIEDLIGRIDALELSINKSATENRKRLVNAIFAEKSETSSTTSVGDGLTIFGKGETSPNKTPDELTKEIFDG